MVDRHPQDVIDHVRAGFAGVKATDEERDTALRNLSAMLADERFAAAHPQLEKIIAAKKFDQLFDAFFREIPFGTGGRRGPVGYGPNRINDHTIATSIEGHAQFLHDRFPELKEISVVVAFDVRIFKDLRGIYDQSVSNPIMERSSRDFAKIAASVYAAHGIQVWMPDPAGDIFISTPELSFAIRHLKAQGGLNVSASHNHPDDNGAKIYNERGSQEIPPLDEALQSIVDRTSEASTVDFDEAVASELIRWLPQEVHDAYVKVNADVSRDRDARSARTVFTPLHGTGFHSAGAALQKAGFDVELFQEQAAPDGTFPNVKFRSPNPEVPQSLESAAAYAKQQGKDLVLGTDPDADRIGMMAPHNGTWEFFTGNEIGAIIAHYLIHDTSALDEKDRPFAVTTEVTSSIFGRICRSANVRVIDDLGVGFKYIADVLNQIESQGVYRDLKARLNDFVLGIEESHGYLVVPHMRDKDAAGAAILLAELASRLKTDGHSFVDYLDGIHREFGYVCNLLVSTVMQGAKGFANIRRIQEGLRAAPPKEIAGRRVTDFIDRWDEDGPLGKFKSGTDKSSRDALTFVLEGDSRITLRPSGTESKNKIYIEVCGAPLGRDVDDDVFEASKAKTLADAHDLRRGFTATMLSYIDVVLPNWAMEVSGLVPLECKRHFAVEFMPELLSRIANGEGGDVLGGWIDESLTPYGADGRLLVRDAVEAYIESDRPAKEVVDQLRDLFGGGAA